MGGYQEGAGAGPARYRCWCSSRRRLSNPQTRQPQVKRRDKWNKGSSRRCSYGFYESQVAAVGQGSGRGLWYLSNGPRS
jgi:hypothetical protein